MNMRPRVLAAVATLALLTAVVPQAQHRLQPVSAMTGRPALELALRKLDTVGSVMMTTAHPDDENNALLAYYGHSQGFRTSLVTATRGEGGQNEIGPELFEALAVLRTEELLAAHRYDGAEQYFTRAVDFGFSFSVEETIEKWGREAIVGDYVRLIRTIRPDVIVGWIFDGEGGGQHHQTSARLTLEAFRAAADPTAYPEQIAEGLRPWQARKYYYTAGFGMGPGAQRPATFTGEGASTPLLFSGGDFYDVLLGRTCTELAAEARSMHKCQGMSQLLPVPQGDTGGFGSIRAYRLRDTVMPDGVQRPERDMFDGIDTRLTALAAYAGAQPPAALTAGLDEITRAVAGARAALAAAGPAAAIEPLGSGLDAVRALRAGLGGMTLPDQARYDIDTRLAQKESQFTEALVLAADLRVDVLAGDGLVVAGQPVDVRVHAGNRGTSSITLGATLAGFGGGAQCAPEALAPGGMRVCRVSATVPTEARLTAAHFRYATDAARFVLDPDVPFGLPFRPTPFVATIAATIAGHRITLTRPVQFRSDTDLFSGEKRAELHVVPTFAVSATPGMLIVPTGANPATARGTSRDVRVTVVNHARGTQTAEVSLSLPQGWTATPATQSVRFSREDESMTVRFSVAVPPSPMLVDAQGRGRRFTIRAVARNGGATYDMGYQHVEYPHTTRRHVLRAPDITVNALDVAVRPGVTVGYVMGVGDEIPAALEQLGARVELLSADQLAWGDLSRFGVIMTGVRAYERRADLRANNQRLIDYARQGGTVIVHYNKFEFNEAQYGPYPGKVGRERVTDEHAAVTVLQPQHPAFTTPNRIGPSDWDQWRQERGLYFFEPASPEYTELLEFLEPFPYNKGTKRGAMVEARVGQGRWMYLGLGLWRQLPAGTDGAYRLMANLISLGR